MKKRLLSSDYKNIVLESFKIPQNDHLKYYSNIIDEHIQNNPDIFQELQSEIHNWFLWHDRETSDFSIRFPRLSKEYAINPDEISIPINRPDFSIQLNKAYLNNQLNIINQLHDKHKVPQPRTPKESDTSKVEKKLEYIENEYNEGRQYNDIYKELEKEIGVHWETIKALRYKLIKNRLLKSRK